jgi:hypothetical protein
LGDNINTIKKNTETLIEASKEVGPEVNTEKLCICYLITRMQGKIITKRQITDPLKMWHSSNIWDGNKSKFDSGGN